jgi:RNA polymerase sigma factor (sigma-70 family)
MSGRPAAPPSRVCDQDQQDLAAQNTNLAYWLAGQAWKRCHYSCELDELTGVAMLALTRAAAHFDPGKGLRFCTLATTCIKRSLKAEIEAATKRGRTFKQLPEMNEDEFDGVPSFFDSSAPDPGRNAMLMEAVLEVKRNLPERWFTLLWMRAQGMGHTEVARRLGMTKQRVQQLTDRAVIRARRVCKKGLRGGPG